MKNCIICNKEFKERNNLQKCCSLYCSNKNQLSYRSKKPKTKTCKRCGDVFSPYNSLDKFCSPKCRIENMKSKRSRNWKPESTEKRKGKNNPAYVHGMSCVGSKRQADGIRLFMKNRDEYRKEIIEKHGYLFCERCGKTGCKFEAHHIIFRSEKPGHPNLHDKINIINVCVSCHNWFHNKKGNRNTLVEDRGLQNVFGNEILNK